MRKYRGSLTTIGVVALLAALATFAARFVPVVNHPLLFAALGAPVGWVAAPVALLGFALARRWVLTVVATVVTLAVGGVAVPSFLPAAARGLQVRVMSMNMQFGEADAASIVGLASRGVDVVAVQEMTPEAAASLSAAGLDVALPHQLIAPRPGAEGIGLWSKYPLKDTAVLDGYEMPAVTARVEIPGVAINPVVASIHLVAPWPQPVEGWRDDIAVLSKTLADLATTAGDGTVLAAGDFNGTTDMKEFRNLLNDGYEDAAQQAGVPFAPTFPADRFTPVIAIDHLLIRNATGKDIETVRVAGTDHMALIVDVAIPADGDAAIGPR